MGAAGALSQKDGGIIDIGGASTEVFFRKAGVTQFSVSMNVGAVRLFDSCRDKKELLDEAISGAISPLATCEPTGTVFAIGGTASTLACIARGEERYSADLGGTRLSCGFVCDTACRLLQMTAEERKKVRGVEEKRADVIAGGAYLLAKIMEILRLNDVVFSDADNLEGYLQRNVIERGGDER